MPLHKYPPKIWEALKLQKGIYARLPQHYLCSLQDSAPPSPVHWRPLGVKYRLSPKSGHRERVQDVPIPVYHPPESQSGLWGGEGWISGFRYAKDDKLSTRLRKTWKPQLFNRELYSEILDQKFTVTVTARTLDLIDAAFGFDSYILTVRSPQKILHNIHLYSNIIKCLIYYCIFILILINYEVLKICSV
uniref:Large ribosomal subunit protein bL28m n=2 Tax=Sinocyclocheilus grahami TaxID=75366 RepID=A0A672KDE3_SINGR